MRPRHLTRVVQVGTVAIGGEHPISIQSMTNTDTRDRLATMGQIQALEEAGCEIIRLAVPDREAAGQLSFYIENTSVPLVADIHFDYQLALSAITAGVSKLRINPGNIGGPDRVRAVADKAKEKGIPIRIGVNAGSLEKELLAKFGGPTPEAMAESALHHIRLLETVDFTEIIISLKASDVPTTIAAYRLLAEQCQYPLHIGITEAGTWFKGSIRSAVGLGILLWEGLGDTLRISLTGDPVREVEVGREILQSLDLRSFGPKVISCPTCGRCQVNLEETARAVETMTAGMSIPLKVAVMGCAVNGPGEAREADLGIAGGKGEWLLFRRGEIVTKAPESEILDLLKTELEKIEKR